MSACVGLGRTAVIFRVAWARKRISKILFYFKIGTPKFKYFKTGSLVYIGGVGAGLYSIKLMHSNTQAPTTRLIKILMISQ